GCTQMAASGKATAAGTFAIGVTVAANVTTTFYAAATDAAGNVSPCSSGLAYTNDTLPPATPVVLGTAPASPSANAHPLVGGTSEAGSLVSVYGSAGCAGSSIGVGFATTSGTFSILAVVTPNATTTITVRAQDAAGNLSVCSNAITYTHDDLPPAAPVLSAT